MQSDVNKVPYECPVLLKGMEKMALAAREF